ncbi:MAG: hypothetical protein KGK07_17040 [Chloroflexota bacterium]|nr:hypothetical protein [Chloroflexota bacterium]
MRKLFSGAVAACAALVLCALACAGASVVSADDGNDSPRNCVAQSGGGCIKVDGSAGWVYFCQAAAVNATTDAQCIRISIARLREVDATGALTRVTVSEDVPATAAASTFRLPTACNATAGATTCGTSANNTALGLNVTLVTVTQVSLMDGTPSIAPTVELSMYIFNEDGVVAFGTDSTSAAASRSISVAAGSFKFNVGVSNYQFAAPTMGTTREPGDTNTNGISVAAGQPVLAIDLAVRAYGQNVSAGDFQESEEHGDGGSVRRVTQLGSGALVADTSFVYSPVDNLSARVSFSTNATVAPIAVEESQVVVIGLPGPFVSAMYDPVVNPTASATTSSSVTSKPIGAIVGGTIGGVAGVAAVALVVYKLAFAAKAGAAVASAGPAPAPGPSAV